MQEDASLALFLPLFALGVVLVTGLWDGLISIKNAFCMERSRIRHGIVDLERVDVGPRPVWILSVVFLLNMLLCALYKELRTRLLIRLWLCRWESTQRLYTTCLWDGLADHGRII